MRTIERARYVVGFTFLNFVILGVIPNLVSDYVRRSLVTFAVAVVAAGVSFVLLQWMMSRLLKRARTGLSLVQRESPAPRPGLIVLMSPGGRQPTAAENAVRSHLPHLEHCWVVFGPDRPGLTPTSRENAERLAGKLLNARGVPVRFHLKELVDEDNPEKCYHLVQSIYNEAKALGLTERDVIADYTGGTKSMTAGMVLACSASDDRDAQYMKATKQTSMGTAAPSSEAVPMMIDLKFGAR